MRKIIIILLLCQYGLFIYKFAFKNAIVSKDTICYLLWYNVIRCSSHIYKKPSFLALHSLSFLVNNTKEVIDENWESVTQVNGKKNVIMQVTYFLNDSVLNIMFYCHVITYWQRVPPLEKFNRSLTCLSLNCLENFIVLMLLMEISKC